LRGTMGSGAWTTRSAQLLAVGSRQRPAGVTLPRLLYTGRYLRPAFGRPVRDLALQFRRQVIVVRGIQGQVRQPVIVPHAVAVVDHFAGQ